MKVYMLAKGQYSGYEVVGIFATEAMAERAARMYTGRYDYPEVTEWEVYTDTIPNKFTLPAWSVYVTDDGIEVSRDQPDLWDDDELNVPSFHTGQDRKHWHIPVLAADADHAKKIAADLVAQRKALWLLDEEGDES